MPRSISGSQPINGTYKSSSFAANIHPEVSHCIFYKHSKLAPKSCLIFAHPVAIVARKANNSYGNIICNTHPILLCDQKANELNISPHETKRQPRCTTFNTFATWKACVRKHKSQCSLLSHCTKLHMQINNEIFPFSASYFGWCNNRKIVYLYEIRQLL